MFSGTKKYKIMKDFEFEAYIDDYVSFGFGKQMLLKSLEGL